MIKTLRRRVVIYTLLSVALVLFLIMGVINVVNFVRIDQSSDNILQYLAENGGEFPRMPEFEREDGQKDEQKDERGRGRGGRMDMTAETPYETRYFTVTLNEDGSVKEIDTGKIAAVSSSDAIQMVNKALSSGKESGYDGHYKYLKQISDGEQLFIFIDCNRDLTSFWSLLRTSLLVAVFAMIAISILVILLSPRMIKPIAESYAKQKEFITNAGHELKTPMAVIESCTEVIEMQSGETKWTTGIREQIKKLTGLTGRLVALAKMDEGADNLVMTELDLSQLAEETLDGFRLASEQQERALETQIEAGIMVKGNRESLSELISILADNALKYGDPKEAIRFSLTKQGKKVLLIQENSAEGLKPGNYEKLFDRFYRGDTSHSSEIPGSGIGLSMAQAIVLSHGGTITAESPDGKHLRFTVHL
ncbi:MAG: HAMP domain-containing histidine kinase [Firmicutes bacterium]|nr:HAMP domain-containing histidine kinase [Bacillota bacterium]